MTWTGDWRQFQFKLYCLTDNYIELFVCLVMQIYQKSQKGSNNAKKRLRDLTIIMFYQTLAFFCKPWMYPLARYTSRYYYSHIFSYYENPIPEAPLHQNYCFGYNMSWESIIPACSMHPSRYQFPRNLHRCALIPICTNLYQSLFRSFNPMILVCTSINNRICRFVDLLLNAISKNFKSGDQSRILQIDIWGPDHLYT